MTLEKVLGITVSGGRGLACDPRSGLVAYPAGWVSWQWSYYMGACSYAKSVGAGRVFWCLLGDTSRLMFWCRFYKWDAGPHKGSVLIVVFVAILSSSLATYTHPHIQIYTLYYTQLPTVFSVFNIYLLVIFVFIIFKIFVLYWNRVDLQCCVSFKCTAKWFSYTYTYILFQILFAYVIT